MSGSVLGGKKAAVTNYERYGVDFYKEIGAKGGVFRSPAKGFGSNKEAAKEAGRKGGLKSKRGKETY